MPAVQQVHIEPMTEESFRPYGAVLRVKERPAGERRAFPADFQADVATTVNVIWQPQAGLRFSKLERHFGVTQTFFQLDGGRAVVAAAPPTDPDDPKAIPPPEDVRAFLIDPAQGFAFKRGTWHSLNRYLLDGPGGTFVILNSSPNPTQIVDYETGLGQAYSNLERERRTTRLEFPDLPSTVFEIVASA